MGCQFPFLFLLAYKKKELINMEGKFNLFKVLYGTWYRTASVIQSKTKKKGIVYPKEPFPLELD